MTSPPSLKAVQAGYDKWAEIYDHDANPMAALDDLHIGAAIGDVSGLEVLDLGCGTGRHTKRLLDLGARVTAVDFSEGMLAEAKRKCGTEQVRFLVQDLQKPLALEDDHFDLVISGLVLEHLAELDLFFGEAHRVLKPGGRAVVSTMHAAMFERGSQARFTDPGTGEVIAPGSVDHDPDDYKRAAQAAGFDLTHFDEHCPDEAFAQRYPRAKKYVGWPMLLVMQLVAKGRP